MLKSSVADPVYFSRIWEPGPSLAFP